LSRGVLLRVLDALELGDSAGAAAIVLAALEDADGPEPAPCSVCGVRAWPGQLGRHIFSAHRAAELETAA
jgi:hypothetical protein